MLTKLKNSKGFTIIEVMIVLAIAGLIILIVLLAVPALQRNNRNTTIKNDVSALVSGVSDFKATNDGAQPTDIAKPAGDTNATFSGTVGSDTVAKVQGSTEVTETGTMPAGPGTIDVAFSKKCNAAGTGLDAVSSPRSVAFLYRVETSAGGAGNPKCSDG